MHNSKYKKNIIWLASYPKSGNTWFRVFLSNLLSYESEAININEIDATFIASSRKIFDTYSGISSSDLTNEEIDIYRPEVYKAISKESNKLVFIKVHDSWSKNVKGHDLFPKEITKGVLYFVRNPLDISVSLSFHNNSTIDHAISCLNSKKFGLCASPNKLNNQLFQRIHSWSEHVNSWLNISGLPIHLVRYEDALSDTFDTFNRALISFQLYYSRQAILRAIENSSFNTLQEQEHQFGFKEKPIHASSFFRQGVKNSWREHLSIKNVNTVIRHHGELMKDLGYSLNID